MVVIPLRRRRPIDQTLWNLFPLAALGTEIPYPVSLHLISDNDLVAAVFENQSLAFRLRKGKDHRRHQENRGQPSSQSMRKGAHETSRLQGAASLFRRTSRRCATDHYP